MGQSIIFGTENLQSSSNRTSYITSKRLKILWRLYVPKIIDIGHIC